MSQQNINLNVLDEQLRTVEVDLGQLNTDSNDRLHQVPSSSGVMNEAAGVPAKNNEGTEISNNYNNKENSAIKLYNSEKNR